MITVLCFPSANEPGLEIAQSLAKSNKINLVGASSYETRYDPSRLYLDRHLHIPALGDPAFEARFRSTVDREGIDLVFTTVDALVAEFATWDITGTRFVVPRADVAAIVLSKRRTYAALRDAVPVPEGLDEVAPGVVAWAKPDIGAGSRFSFPIRDEDQLRIARRLDLMVLEYLPGPEYTVDCVGDLDGKLLACNVRRRAVVGRGIALASEGIDAPDIVRYVKRIADLLPIAGPWFAQFKENANHQPVLLEVNARVAGSMSLTRLSGLNIPLLCAFMFAGDQVQAPRIQRGILVSRFLRTWGEVDDFDAVVWDLDDTLVRKDGKIDPDVVARVYDLHNQGRDQYLVTKHVDARVALRDLQIPDLFVEVLEVENKVASVAELLAARSIEPSRCIVINDSMSERFGLEQRFPTLRVIGPDALDLLKRERAR